MLDVAIFWNLSFGSRNRLVDTVTDISRSTIDSSTVNSMNLIPTQRPAGES